MLRSQEVAYCIFLEMRIIFFEVISECEGDNRKSSIVVGAVFALVVLSLALFVLVVALLTVDITDLSAVSNRHLRY